MPKAYTAAMSPMHIFSPARLIVVTALLLSACSHQQMYDSFADAREDHCDTLDEYAREHCLQQAQMPYQDYQREREDAEQADGGQ